MDEKHLELLLEILVEQRNKTGDQNVNEKKTRRVSSALDAEELRSHNDYIFLLKQEKIHENNANNDNYT